jgi:uncharacterized protein YyaL (SSP411 family)
MGPTHEIVVAERSQDSGSRSQETGVRNQESGARKKEADQPILARLHQRFVPNKIVHLREGAISDEQLPAATRSLLSGKSASQGQTTVYICQLGTCSAPLVGDAQIEDGLAQL